MMLSTILVSLLTADAGVNCPVQAVVWSAADGGNSHAYLALVVDGGISWDDANADALARSGYLATISSSDENAFIFGFVAADDRLWLNGSDGLYGPWLGGTKPLGAPPAPEIGWTWVSEQPWSFTSWAGGQPNNFTGTERFLHFAFDRNSPSWNDCCPAAQPPPESYVVEFECFPDAGPPDAGPPGPRTRLEVGCHCNATGGFPFAFLALVFFRRVTAGRRSLLRRTMADSRLERTLPTTAAVVGSRA